jgi:thiol-disulfide isomerase/thioredoxin
MKRLISFAIAVLVISAFLGCATRKDTIKVTVTEYYHPSCETCVAMMPIVDAVQDEFKGNIIIVKVSLDTKEGAKKAAALSIVTIPMFVFSDFQGVDYYRHDGKMTKEEIEKIIRIKLL